MMGVANDHQDRQAGGPGLPEGDTPNIADLLGTNLKRLRTRHGFSLDRLSKLSGVSRAMLSQIELRRSVPTINLVFKIATALKVPFSTLLADTNGARTQFLPASEAKILTSGSGEFKSRALFPFNAERGTEFYEIRLTPHGTENAEPHAAGTLENLVVMQGDIEIEAGGTTSRLSSGDAILFHADGPHSYRNLSDREAVIYLVMSYAETQN